MGVTVTEKRCPRCRRTLAAEHFATDQCVKDGLRAYCRECNREIGREYRAAHPDRERAKHQKYREAHRTERLARTRLWKMENREHLREYAKTLYANDAEFKTRALASSAVNKSILRHGGSKKRQPWEVLVGYSLADLMGHIEAQFVPGMTWANRDKWHIDHIIPQAFFKFTSADSPAFRECWALSNLRPMWAKDNHIKNDKLPNGLSVRRLQATA